MAVMHPTKLPDDVLEDRMLRGEVKTYNALRKLPDEFVVFYQCHASSNGSSKAFAKPADFVVLNKKLGLLAVEVKGGKIRLGKETAVEQFYERRWNPIDPYEQVTKAMIALIMNCKADGANYWIPDNTCVIFPDAMRSAITNTPHLLPNGTLCAEDMGMLSVQIKTLFARTRNVDAFSNENFLDMQRRLEQRIFQTRRRYKKKSVPAVSTKPAPTQKISTYQPKRVVKPQIMPTERTKMDWRNVAMLFLTVIVGSTVSTFLFLTLINMFRHSF